MFPKVVTQTSEPFPASMSPVPLLEDGAYLTRAEFERRYEAMPSHLKAELIEGRVCMSSPVRRKNHSIPDNHLSTWLGVYAAVTPGVLAGNNGTVRLDEWNEVQPDSDLRIDETRGGQALVSSDDYLEGAPELVIEIAASSAPRDLREKFTVYQRNGVREYIVWAVADGQIHWFSLEAGTFTPLNPDPNGYLCSRVFPGLWLDVQALLRGEMAQVLQVLQQGLAAPEHAEFITALARRHTPL
ncbi:MAG: Uma2 family endonuclease [Acidobacteria bacterium]|nr:Uma2 family endonuclease [Acidobacteriota bacterium]MBI3423577.1 Uma2 family endonuclease [Acidobacteriota bacterium]